MSAKKAKKTNKAESEAAETTGSDVTATRLPNMLDPFDRFWIDEFMPWLGLRGQHWPTRMFADLAEMRGSIKVEEFTENGATVIRAELPGVDPDDIDISVKGNRLTLKAERRSQTESSEDDTYRSEFRYGSFTRMVSLPEGALADDIAASYVDGVLELRIPTAEDPAKKTKRIQVTRG